MILRPRTAAATAGSEYADEWPRLSTHTDSQRLRSLEREWHLLHVIRRVNASRSSYSGLRPPFDGPHSFMAQHASQEEAQDQK